MSTNPVWADKKLTKQERANMAFRYLDWLLTKNVPSGGFRLLYAILKCLNDENQFHCFPSIDYLAARIERTRSTVWEMLPKLEKIGAIEIEWGSQGSRHPNTYRLPAAFLEFYFGPEKGRQPKLVLVPKKPRQTGVSKPRQKHRQTGVSNAPKTPVQPPENTGLTPKKPRQTGVNNLIATLSNKSAPPARSSARVDRGNVTETETTADDAPLNPAFTTANDAAVAEPLTPIPRASSGARIQPLAQEKQPASCRASPEMGAAANADAAPAFDATKAAFEKLKRDYPPHRIGNDAEAYRAFCAALAARRSLSAVVEDFTSLTLDYGEDVPRLADLLTTIERIP
jgi:hypothetical protein